MKHLSFSESCAAAERGGRAGKCHGAELQRPPGLALPLPARPQTGQHLLTFKSSGADREEGFPPAQV